MTLPSSAPPSRGATASREQDLSEAEFHELAGLLEDVPEPLKPFALDEADGFIAGVAVQPAPVDDDEWLRYVFDSDGHRWGEATPSPERARAGALLLRRETAIRSALAEVGSFDPWLADAGESGDAVVATVAPWIAGFLAALEIFPLAAEPDADVDAVVEQLERYLADPPVEPPATVEAAIADVMLGVWTLYERSEAIRYRVATARRDAPKVGRNDPCPCGSGKKFKQCHGAVPTSPR